MHILPCEIHAIHLQVHVNATTRARLTISQKIAGKRQRKSKNRDCYRSSELSAGSLVLLLPVNDLRLATGQAVARGIPRSSEKREERGAEPLPQKRDEVRVRVNGLRQRVYEG